MAGWWGVLRPGRAVGRADARPTAIDSHGGNVQTEMLHGDVIIGTSVYHEFDRELSAASDADLYGYQVDGRRWLVDDDGCVSREDGNQQSAGRLHQQRHINGRADADVRRDVLRALLLDSLMPLTVDAWVSDGVVTLTGTVGTEPERKDAIVLAGSVPGVVGVLDELARRPRPCADDEATREAVTAALAGAGVADLADLTVEACGWGSVVLSGSVQSRSDHDLAIAIAWSVADVQCVEDCIQVES